MPLFSQEEKQKAARFQAEAKAAGRLRHPNIVPTFDPGQVGDQFYIASQFIEGKSLSATIKDKKIDFKQAAKWKAAIARALDYTHKRGMCWAKRNPLVAGLLMGVVSVVSVAILSISMASPQAVEVSAEQHRSGKGPGLLRGTYPDCDY